MSTIGKMWKELPDTQRKAYQDAAAREKAAFMVKYPEGLPPAEASWISVQCRPRIRTATIHELLLFDDN